LLPLKKGQANDHKSAAAVLEHLTTARVLLAGRACSSVAFRQALVERDITPGTASSTATIPSSTSSGTGSKIIARLKVRISDAGRLFQSEAEQLVCLWVVWFFDLKIQAKTIIKPQRKSTWNRRPFVNPFTQQMRIICKCAKVAGLVAPRPWKLDW